MGARRPLTTREASLAFNAATAYDEDRSVIKESNLAHLERQVRDWCGLFVFIKHFQLFLIHQTAKEFLVTDLVTSNAGVGVWKSSLSTVQVELEMAIMCITYLCLTAVGQHVPEQAANDKDMKSDFVGYCSEHWTSHLRDHNITNDKKLLDMVLRLYDTAGRRFSTWFPLMWRATHHYTPTPRIQDQHAIAMSGHAVVLTERYKKKTFELDLQDSFCRTSLMWAAEAGHVEAVQMLLDTGADVNAKGGDYSSALHLASAGGHEQVVQILLDTGADINAEGGDYSSALQAASARGHKQVVQILSQYGAKRG